MQEPLPPVPVQKEGESQKTRKLYWKGMESLSADNAELYLRPVLLEKNYGHKVPSLLCVPGNGLLQGNTLAMWLS